MYPALSKSKIFYFVLAILFLGLAYFVFSGFRKSPPKEVIIPVTIPEGFTSGEAATAFASKLPSFNQENFLREVEGKEGYLFPDTYFFFKLDDEEDALRLMSDNFEKKMAPLREDIFALHKTEKEIITMASIIEKEAKGNVDRALISGILWKRYAIGMPLQADAALETYDSKGLPRAPICNPGLESIKAAIYPEKSDFLYYLHDEEGNTHYAKNFEEHKQNKLKYLK